MNFNQVTFMGNLTRDPETRETGSGKKVCAFSIAVNDAFNKDAKAMFLRVECWEKTGEVAQKYLTKGAGCLVSGRLKIEEWKDKEGQTRTTPVVICNQLVLGARAAGHEAEPRREEKPAAPAEDDSMPF